MDENALRTEVHLRLGESFSRLSKRRIAHVGSFAGVLLACSCALVLAEGTAHNYLPETADHLKHSRDLIGTGNFADARSELNDVVKRDPTCVDGFELIGLSYLKQGDFAQAEAALDKAYELEPENSSILNNLGNALYRQGKVDQSIEIYKKALAVPNDEPYKIWVNLGNSYSDQSKLDDAIDAFNRALQLKPGFAPAYLGLGRMYCEHGKLTLAERELRDAVKYKPDYSSAYYYLGRVEKEKGNYTESLAALEKSLMFEQNRQYQFDTKQYMAAVEARMSGHHVTPPVSQSQSIEPATPETKSVALDRVTQRLMQREWSQAQHLLLQINARYGKDDPVVWNNLGYALMHQASKTNTALYLHAIEDYKTAIKLKRGAFPTAQYNLGEAYRLLDSHKYSREAEDAFRQAISDAQSLSTMCPLAQNGLGLVLRQRGNLKAADAAYRRAISQSGTELPVAHYNLALLLEQCDRMRDAANEYKAYLTLEPRGFNAEKARTRLKRLGVEPPAPPPMANTSIGG
jgi:tetratricopeptide (TPR) repeat protein